MKHLVYVDTRARSEPIQPIPCKETSMAETQQLAKEFADHLFEYVTSCYWETLTARLIQRGLEIEEGSKYGEFRNIKIPGDIAKSLSKLQNGKI